MLCRSNFTMADLISPITRWMWISNLSAYTIDLACLRKKQLDQVHFFIWLVRSSQYGPRWNHLPLLTLTWERKSRKLLVVSSVLKKYGPITFSAQQSTPDAKKFWSVFSILFVTPHAFRVILQPNFLPLKQNALVKNTLSFWAILYKYLYNR